MASFKYVGEINDISERQLEFVSSVLTERGFSDASVQVSAVGKPGDNYLASVKRFTIAKDGQTFKMVAKIGASNEVARIRMNTKRMFLNEHVIYTYLLPKFTELEKGSDIPENERFRYATCYGSLSEEPNEIILLEDLQEPDFVMLDKSQPFTDETVKLVIKNFAILHSLSYALKNREPETYVDIKNKLVNRWSLLLENKDLLPMFDQVENNYLSTLDNAEQKNIVTGLVPKLPIFAAKNCKIDKGSKYSVIQQGDSWTNNLMFKLEGNKVDKCCMIDYQLANESSPVADLHYMIFVCTDYETRYKHYHEWIDYYYTHLDKCLFNFELKVNLVYPRDQFDADLRRYGKYSFGMAMMLANMILVAAQAAANRKDAVKGESNEEEDILKRATQRFKTKVKGLVNSFLELGYL